MVYLACVLFDLPGSTFVCSMHIVPFCVVLFTGHSPRLGRRVTGVLIWGHPFISSYFILVVILYFGCSQDDFLPCVSSAL